MEHWGCRLAPRLLPSRRGVTRARGITRLEQGGGVTEAFRGRTSFSTCVRIPLAFKKAQLVAIEHQNSSREEAQAKGELRLPPLCASLRH